MHLSIVIPNFNGEKLLPDLLTALRDVVDNVPLSEVIVADDASTDESISLIRASYPWVRIVEGERNLGFGGNCNRGAEAAGGEFLAFVNSDIRLDNDPFAPLLDLLTRKREVFAVMPLIFAEGLGRVENVNTIWKRRGLVWLRSRDELPLADIGRLQLALEGEAPVPVPLCGAFFVCRRELFRQLGGFASEFAPAYWEDVDLGLRAEEAGYKVAVAPQVVVRHLHSQTMDQVMTDRRKRSLLLRNQALLMERHLETLRPLPWFRWYLALRLPQRMLAGHCATVASYLRLIFRRR
ncbi:MAG: hypothetical protein B1H03_00800 [Planctomycetales bacterium 4484_113]|nr:MAG: hypothetical protein B1H03_00800 [Planctomycetales bacterium 4484_113]